MKRFFSLVAVFCASATFAADVVPAPAPAKALPAEAAKPATVVALKPVVRQARPLHRHPTLFGMLRQNNDIRRRLGLRAHRMNPALTKAAQDHANYMAQTAQFSHHANGGPQYRANKYGFRGGVLENIAYGSRTVNSTFGMWVGSSGHYASIVSGTSDAGFGYAIAPSGQCYWVGVYATPAAGDAPGETEEQIAQAMAEEKQAALAAAEVKKDPSVVPASATEPVKEDEAPAQKPADKPADTEAVSS